MRDAVKKYAPTKTIDTSLPTASPSQQTMRDIVKKNIPSQQEVPVSKIKPTTTTPTTSTYIPTLLDTYNKRKDVQESFSKRFPGQNPTVMGTKANRALNDWWASAGKKEAADMVKKGWAGK